MWGGDDIKAGATADAREMLVHRTGRGDERRRGGGKWKPTRSRAVEPPFAKGFHYGRCGIDGVCLSRGN